MDRIRVLIADEHTLVRDGTRRILEAEGDMEVVAEATDGEEAVQLTAELKPDVVLMDIAMPKVDGIAATKQIKQECPDIVEIVGAVTRVGKLLRHSPRASVRVRWDDGREGKHSAFHLLRKA